MHVFGENLKPDIYYHVTTDNNLRIFLPTDEPYLYYRRQYNSSYPCMNYSVASAYQKMAVPLLSMNELANTFHQ